MRIAAVVVLATGLAQSENISSSVKGTVVDETLAAVPSAACTLTNQSTGGLMTATSWSDGGLIFVHVAPGRYTLKIKAEGFKTLIVKDVAVAANEIRTLGNLVLQIGAVVESITITGDMTAAVQLAGGERSGLVGGEQLDNLALKGRDYFALLQTIPGVVDTYSESREVPSYSSIRGTYINGSRDTHKNYIVDGVFSLNSSHGSVVGQPNMDAVIEVRVLTSNYPAEYGRQSGGVISVITRSGTQNFHGSAHTFFRHEGLNANEFFNNRRGVPKAPYRYRIYGYSLGGPAYIPERFNSDKTKLFFFFSQEYTGIKKDWGSVFANVPSERERRGDFSNSVDVGGNLIPVTDPLGGTPFPNNIIPPNRLHPLGQSIVNFFPLPNFTDPDPRDRYRWNHRSVFSGDNPMRNHILRVDANPAPDLKVSYRFFRNSDTQEIPWGNWMVENNFLAATLDSRVIGTGQVLHLTKSPSSTLVNETQFGLNRHTLSSDYTNKPAMDRSQMGNPPQWFEHPGLPHYAPDVSFGSQPVNAATSQFGVAPWRWRGTLYLFANHLSKVWGAHSFKTGIAIERYQTDSHDTRATWRGAFDFGQNSLNPLDANHGFANALLGNFSSYTELTLRGAKDLLRHGIEAYFQDNWRVSRRLTLDYGIRLYRLPPEYDRNHTAAGFNPVLYDPTKTPALYMPAVNPAGQRVARDPLTGKLEPAAFIGMFVPGSGDFANGSRTGGIDGYPRGLFTRPAYLAPRFGFAYDPFGRGRTALRGGFGVFYDTPEENPLELTSGNPPVAYDVTVFNGNLDNLPAAAGAGLVGPSSLMQPAIGRVPLPRTTNFSMGVQHQARGTVIDISYVGAVSSDLIVLRNINPVPIYARFDPRNADPTRPGSPLPDTFFSTYLGYGPISVFEPIGTSNYHSLQVAANHRLSSGLQFGLAYTRSKALGVGSDDWAKITPYFSPRSWDYGPLSYDRSHVFVASFMYELPRLGSKMGRPVGWLLDRWQISGITSFISGAPFTPGFSTTDGQDITGSSQDPRITVIRNPSLDKGRRTFFRTFDTEAFVRTPRMSFGNAGIGILRGPGVNNWDLSVSKRIPLGTESRHIRFRAEFFNAWNHTQFSGVFDQARFDPAGRQVDPNFGAYSSARRARIIQFSLRVAF